VEEPLDLRVAASDDPSVGLLVQALDPRPISAIASGDSSGRIVKSLAPWQLAVNLPAGSVPEPRHDPDRALVGRSAGLTERALDEGR
jgi:hypothetical protein